MFGWNDKTAWLTEFPISDPTVRFGWLEGWSERNRARRGREADAGTQHCVNGTQIVTWQSLLHHRQLFSPMSLSKWDKVGQLNVIKPVFIPPLLRAALLLMTLHHPVLPLLLWAVPFTGGCCQSLASVLISHTNSLPVHFCYIYISTSLRLAPSSSNLSILPPTRRCCFCFFLLFFFFNVFYQKNFPQKKTSKLSAELHFLYCKRQSGVWRNHMATSSHHNFYIFLLWQPLSWLGIRGGSVRVKLLAG